MEKMGMLDVLNKPVRILDCLIYIYTMAELGKPNLDRLAAAPGANMDDPSQISRRTFFATFGVIATGVLAYEIIGKVEKSLKSELPPEQKQKALEVVNRLKEKYPVEKYGHVNLPWGFDENGVLRILRAGTNVADGWDCFDASLDLAVELDKAGFVSGVILGQDKLKIWDRHSRAFVEVGGDRFELDLTPPYHNGNAGKFDVGHGNDESRHISEMPWAKNPKKDSRHNPEILAKVPYPFEYIEKKVDGKTYGYMFSVLMDQRDNMGPISRDGGKIYTGGVLMEFVMDDSGNEPSFDWSRAFAYVWDDEEGQLIPGEGHLNNHSVVSPDETARFLVENQDIEKRVVDGFSRFQGRFKALFL